MKATHQIEPGLLDNAASFDDPFFRRFKLRPAARPLSLNEKVAKNYLFPTLYGEVTCAQAIFPCPWERAYALMPHPLLHPVRLPGGRAVVAFSCYVYRRVLGVAPYNEIAMTIPVVLDPDVNVPVLPLLWGGFPGAGYYVFSMPVTSYENQLRGLRIWGLPKVVNDIDIELRGDRCVTTAADEKGETYFTLEVPIGGKPKTLDQSAWLYTELDKQMYRSRTSFAADFQVNMDAARLWKPGAAPERPFLFLGDGPAAAALHELQIEPAPLQTRFTAAMNSCFDLPDPDFISPATFR